MNMLQSANSARGMAAAAMKTGAGAVTHHTTVLPEPTEFEGYLEKLKRNNTSVFSLSSWNTRYFWLDPRSCQLLYYKSKKTSKSRSPSGGFRLEDILYICFDDKQLIVKGGSKKRQQQKAGANHNSEAYDSINGKKKTKNTNYQFSIQTKERYYVLRAKTQSDFRKWTRILSSWLKTHIERVEEAEKQRLIDNGLSLYPRHPENKKDTVDAENNKDTSNNLIKNPNASLSAMSDSTISHSPNSDASHTPPSNFATHQETPESGTSSVDDGNDWASRYKDEDLSTVKHCLDLDDDVNIDHKPTMQEVEANLAIGPTQDDFEEKSAESVDEANAFADDLHKLKLQSEMCLKRLKTELDKTDNARLSVGSPSVVPPPPLPPKGGRRSVARRAMLDMRTVNSPGTIAKIVEKANVCKASKVESKYDDDSDSKNSEEEGEYGGTCTTPVHDMRSKRNSDDESNEGSEEDEEDSFIAAKLSQDKERRSAAWNNLDKSVDNFGINLNTSELVLSEEEDEEDIEKKDVWLVDRNSWDDEDDVVETEGKEESKTTVEQEGPAIDMETWDSDSDESTC